MKRDIEWLKEAIGELDLVDTEFEADGMCYMDRAVSVTQVRDLIDQLDEPEMLSQEWIDKNKTSIDRKLDGTPIYKVREDFLQNLLVPKQELPVIPKYVGEWIEDIKPNNSLRVAFEYISQRKGDDYDDPLAFWVEEGNSETFARAWLDGYKVEEEPIYYALIKGHELSSDNLKYWHCEAYHLGRVLIGAKHPKQRCINRMTKKNWKIYGINDSNADFEAVQG